MKPACLRLTPLLLIWLLSGCAAAIDHYSGRFRNTLAAGQTRTTIRTELGEPQLCQQAAFLTEDKVQGCDRFTVLGKIHKRADGNGQATASAVTMGLGELILIPMTVASVAGGLHRAAHPHRLLRSGRSLSVSHPAQCQGAGSVAVGTPASGPSLAGASF